MSNNTVIQAVTNIELKIKVEQILNSLGITPDEAINLFYNEIVLQNKLPFEVKYPNQCTVLAIKDSETKKGKLFSSIDDLFDDLND